MTQQHRSGSLQWLYLFIGAAVLVNFSALPVTIIGPDGTLYATIAKTMVLRHDYAGLYAMGADWLDKPHFPFWVTALFFQAFGFHTWSYKLPGILFLMMGAWYTYLFARNLYGRQTALWSVLILLTAQHIVLSNNDVRAEPFLTGLVIAAVFHFYRVNAGGSRIHLLAGSLFAACAVMTKGMFAVIPIAGAIGGHLLIRREWTRLLSWKWLLAAVLTMLLITPELYCLYIQFDLHPEKVIFGRQHVSGIRWFFWDSQFGRFFNTGPIRGSGDPFFFVHTVLWAFLPWSLLLFAAVFQFIRKGIRQPLRKEWYCVCGSLLTFMVFSASRFQLPHYLNIVFPFFAILCAQFTGQLSKPAALRTAVRVQSLLLIILLLLLGALEYFFRPPLAPVAKIILPAAVLIAVFLSTRMSSSDGFRPTAFRTLMVSFLINLYLNLAFYPALLHYQALTEAARWVNSHNPDRLPVVQTGDVPFAMEFYLKQPLTNINPDGSGPLPPKPFLLFAPEAVIHDLENKGWRIMEIHRFQRYWISRLKLSFLNYATRKEQLGYSKLVLVR